MSRLVIHEDQRPVEVKIGEVSKLICMCGLSNSRPFCDGTHLTTKSEDPDKIYRYDEHGRHEVKR